MEQVTVNSIYKPLKPKGSPEYQKDYKPENNAGCCQKYTPETEPVVIKRTCCSIRYKI